MLKVLLNLTENLYTKVNNNILNYPTLGILGKIDLLTPPQYCYDYFKIIKCRDVTFKEYDYGYHDVIHDEEGDEVCKEILAWVDKKIQNAPKFGFFNKNILNILTLRFRLIKISFTLKWL